MNRKSINIKLVLGTIYVFAISIGLYFLFSVVDLKDLTSYEFIRENIDIILKSDARASSFAFVITQISLILELL